MRFCGSIRKLDERNPTVADRSPPIISAYELSGKCPHCHTKNRFANETMGKTVLCVYCDGRIKVPNSDVVMTYLTELENTTRTAQPPVEFRANKLSTAESRRVLELKKNPLYQLNFHDWGTIAFPMILGLLTALVVILIVVVAVPALLFGIFISMIS